jgi:hypothetical protein
MLIAVDVQYAYLAVVTAGAQVMPGSLNDST